MVAIVELIVEIEPDVVIHSIEPPTGMFGLFMTPNWSKETTSNRIGVSASNADVDAVTFRYDTFVVWNSSRGLLSFSVDSSLE